MKVSEIKAGSILMPTKNGDETYPRKIISVDRRGFEFQRVLGDGYTGKELMCENQAKQLMWGANAMQCGHGSSGMSRSLPFTECLDC